jgi:hypothetical protein
MYEAGTSSFERADKDGGYRLALGAQPLFLLVRRNVSVIAESVRTRSGKGTEK